MPETEVLSCPACRRPVRVPADWLGQTVQCPECQAKFTAPVREGGRLTEAVLLAAPAPVNPPADPWLTLPAWGLMFVGVVGVLLNGYFAVRFSRDPDALRQEAGDRIGGLRGAGFGADEPEEERDARDAERNEQAARIVRWLLPVLAVCGVVAFAGGLSIVRRRHYRLALLGCVAGTFAAPQLCCVPGAVFGLWGLLMLMGEEGRAQFVGGGVS